MSTPDNLAIVAGSGVYPLLLAREARRAGVQRIFAVAFRRETDRAIERLADEVAWIHIGQLGRGLDALRGCGCRHVILCGRLAPSHIFSIRLDGWSLRILGRLPVKNAHTVFGAVVDELRAVGLDVLPASTFMEPHMPGAGRLSVREATAQERLDIELGMRVATATSGIEIGQTVVIRQGMVVAVEAMEGTDQAIRRGGKIGGPGAVVVKVAKEGHDMRFDIPVIGLRTLKSLKAARAAVLAFQAGKAILLERDAVIARADAMGLCLVGVERAAPKPTPPHA